MPSHSRQHPALDRFFTYRLHLISKLSDKVSSQAYQDILGLSLGEGRCLAAIGQFEPISIQDLAHLANLDKANASRAAVSLAGKKLVVRQAHERDGRSISLSLTSEGKGLWASAMKLIALRNEEIFGVLNDRESKALDQAFDKIIRHLQDTGKA